MDCRFKKDKEQIEAFLDSLYGADWLLSSQKWWPKYVYHFTNINNAIQILEDECLYCRHYLENRHRMLTDNASSDVISNTDSQWTKYVRLYFRPKTPTQYRNEGFRPVNQRYDDAHCPVPVFFLFDAKKVLSQADTKFSDGNLASPKTNVYERAEDLEDIPFDEVYHDSWFPPEYRDQIIHHRHAEILIPNRLTLENLSSIICRTEAEHETLLNLLSHSAFNKWSKKIGASKKGNLFYREWLFIEKVNFSESHIEIVFNDSNKVYDSFNIKVELKDLANNEKNYKWEKHEYLIPAGKTKKLRLPPDLTNLYHVQIYFDEQIMYSNDFIYNIPF